MPPLLWCAWLFVYFIAARELFCAMAVPTENSDNTARLRAQVIAINFISQVFSSAKIQAVASLEPRGSSSRFVSRASDIRRATRKSLLPALFLR